MLRNCIQGAVDYLLGSGDKEALREPKPASSNDEARQHRSMAQSGIEGSDSVEIGGSRKRAIVGESQTASPKKRLDARSEDEKRLTGNFAVPKTARRISLPGAAHSDEAGEQPKSTAMAQKPRAGRGFQITNTLNSSPHAAVAHKNKANDFVTGYANKNPIRKPAAPEQNGVPRFDRTIDVQPPKSSYGDGFEGHERDMGIEGVNNRNKRRKIEREPSKSIMSSNPVDLTGDDEVTVRVVARNGKSIQAPSLRQQDSFTGTDSPPRLFQATEFERVNAHTTIPPQKRRRKSKDGQRSSQGSSHGTPAEAMNGHASMTGVSPQKIIHAVLKEEIKYDEFVKQTGRERPPINLDDGVDTINDSFSGIAEKEQHETTRRCNDAVRRFNGMPTQGAPKRNDGLVRNRALKESMNGKKDGESSRYFAAEPERLSKVFTRDEGIPFTQRATQKMKAVSLKVERRVSPINDGSDSADELAGGNTIGSQASRSASPHKQATTNVKSRDVNPMNGSSRASSPSDLPATQFTRGTRGRRAENARPEPIDKYELSAFYSTCRIHTSGRIEMRYDKHENQFDLYKDGMLEVIYGKQIAVSIGKTDVSQAFYCKGDYRVFLKGSSKCDSSNGRTCIAFRSWEHVRAFLDQLYFITDYFLNQVPVELDHLDNLFRKQANEIEEMYKRESHKREKKEIDALAQLKRGTPLQTEEDEQIQYEPSKTTDGAPRRSFEGRTSKEMRWLHEQSRSSQDLQPRRSSRQSRILKALSPSPPPIRKWTEENKLPHWAQSVVYPPKGIRRVTVDFPDIERLDEGEFLNDNIISYALRRIEENMSPVHKDSVYFFNSFFYTALTTKNGRSSFNYDAVKRWTKNTDLLSFPYVVVPINIDLHWFVMIVCNLPTVSRKVAGLEDVDEAQDQEDNDASPNTRIAEFLEADGHDDEMLLANHDDVGRQPDANSSSPTMTDALGGKEVRAQTKAMSQLSLSPEDIESKIRRFEEDGSGMTIDPLSVGGLPLPEGKLIGGKKSKKRAPPPVRKYDPDQPTIVTLDSFGGPHTNVTRNLKDYLRAEADAKRSMDLDTKELQGMSAKGIPQQTNFCDCGLYLIGYVEQFAKDPRRFITKVLTRQLDKQADFASFDPSAKRDEIRTELLKLYEDQDADRKAKKSAKKGRMTGVAEAPAPSPTQATKKITKPQELQAPALDVTMNTVKPREPERPTQPSNVGDTAIIDELPLDNQGEDELEIDVPRALKTSATPVSKSDNINKSDRNNAKSGLEKELPLQNGNTERKGGGHTPVTQQDIDNSMAMDEADEEMLDTAGDLDANETTWRSDDAQFGSGNDPLSTLEQVVNDNILELQKPPDASETIDRHAPQPPTRKTRHTHAKATINTKREVIDLDAEEDAEPEVLDSQEMLPPLVP